MIQGLADYESASSKVEATEESLLQTLIFATPATDISSTSTASPTTTTTIEHASPGYAKTLLLRLPTSLSESDRAANFTPGAVAGMAMYFNNYSTWRSKPGVYLEDLFVKPQYRKRGYGKALIQALAQEVVRIGGGRLEWSCLKSNTASLAFYKSLGAEQMVDWVQLRVDGERLERLASAAPGGGVKGVKSENGVKGENGVKSVNGVNGINGSKHVS